MARLSALPILSMCAFVLAIGGCNGGDGFEAGPSHASIVLSVAGGEAIDEVAYVISGDAMEPMAGVINTSAPGATPSVEVFGLPPGNGYEVFMSAMAGEPPTTCEGSAAFSVEAAEISEVLVHLNCKVPPRYGGVRVDGTFNLCATLEKVVAAPLQTSLGNQIDLRAEAADPEADSIAYAWTAISGEIDGPADPETFYTCTDVGEDAITVTASDDPLCVDSWTVPIFCVDGEEPARAWSEPQALEDSDKGALNPQVALDDEGNAVAVWEQPDDGIWSIRANRYVSEGGWGVAETIEDSRLGVDDPRVVMDPQGNAIAVWEQSGVRAARLTPDDGWGAPEVFSEGTGLRIGSLDIGVDASGVAMVVWGQYGIVGGFHPTDVWSNRYDPLEGWGAPQSLEDDDTSSARETQVAVDAAGNALAIWLQSGQLWSCLYTPALGWSSPEVAVEDGQGIGSAAYAELALDEFGRGIAVWSRRGESTFGYSIWAAHYTTGEGWGAPQVLAVNELNTANYPDLANDADGNAIAVWVETTPPGTPHLSSLWSRRYSPDAGWGPATLLGKNDPGSVRNPSIAMAPGGSAVVVWTKDMSAPAYVWSAHYEPSLGWGPRTPIGAAGANRVSYPHVAMDALGRATAVWEQSLPNDTGSTTSSIWASRFE